MFQWFRKKIKHNPMFDKHHDIIAIELTKPFRDRVAVLLSLNRLLVAQQADRDRG